MTIQAGAHFSLTSRPAGLGDQQLERSDVGFVRPLGRPPGVVGFEEEAELGEHFVAFISAVSIYANFVTHIGGWRADEPTGSDAKATS